MATETLEETITVRGEAVVPGEPDEAHLFVRLSSTRPTPHEALENVAVRSQALDLLFGELQIPPPDLATSGLSVREKREWMNRGSIHRGYEAYVTIIVRLDEPGLIGRLTHGAVERAEAHVEGPVWRVALENPARAEACRQAARDARRKAEAYAEALGIRLGPIASISETTPRTDFSQRWLDRETFSAEMASGASLPELEVQPGTLDVTAKVAVTFRIEQG